MKMLRLLCILLLATPWAWSTTYYVSNAGSNSNAGNAGAPFAFAPGMLAGCTATCASTTLVPGDNVLFRKGDTWRDTLTVGVSGSLAGGPITYGAYGLTTTANPIITGSDVVSGFANGGSNIWDKTSFTVTPGGSVVINGALGTKKASRAACTTPGDWFWVANTLSVFSTVDPSGNVQAAQRAFAITTNGKDYLQFTSLTLYGATNVVFYGNATPNLTLVGVQAKWSTNAGALIRGCSNGLFVNDDFTQNGPTGGFQADSGDTNLKLIGVSSSFNSKTGMDFEGVVGLVLIGVDSHDNGSATQEGSGINITQNTGTQPSSNIQILDSSSHDNFGNNVDVIAATTGDIGVSNLLVSGGRFYNAKFSTDAGSGIRLDQNTNNSTIQYVKSYNNNSGGIVNEVQSNNNRIMYNQLWGNARGLTLTNGPGCGNLVVGNVMAFNTDSGIATSGGTCQSTFRNNIMAFNTNYGYDTDNAFAFDLDYNLVFGNGVGNYHFVSKPTNDLNVDPQFVNGTANDFRLKATSPAIDAGQAQAYPYRLGLSPLSVYSSTPITVDQNFFGAGWDIGAFVNIPNYQPMDGRVH